MNLRTLAARGPTQTPIADEIPRHTRLAPQQRGPSTPSPHVYSGTVPVQATLTANPAGAQAGFEGLSYASSPANAVHPPDPWVAVGPDHVVQAVNRSLRITDRSGGSPLFVSLADFFETSGLPVTFNADPRVIFDSLHGRWIATELSWDCAPGPGASFGHGYIDVRISDTSDPSGSWSGFYVYFNDLLPDYPALGTSSDKVALTSNIFVMLGGAGNCAAGANVGYAGTDTIVLDWSAILNITTLPIDEYGTSFDYFTPRVAVQTPATSAPLRMIIQKEVVGGILDVSYVTITGLVGAGGGTTASEVDLTALNVVRNFLDPIPPRQPAGVVTTAIDSRPTDAIWQSNKLTFVSTQACTPTGDSAPRDCVRVSQLNTSPATPTLVQDFLIAQNGADSYMGGIGQSGNGALFVVWTRSSTTAGAYASSYGAYQLPTDGPNSISPPELLAAGQANYTGNRWGDYVGVAQDPQDRNAVWQGNEYASSDGNWATLISQLKTTVVGATFVPLTPARLLDSRFGTGLSGPFQALTPRTFQITGLGGVPASATAVTGNLTATNQTQAGFVFLGPDPMANPTSSTLNFPFGDTRANGVTVALSLGGTLSATFGYAGSTHLIFDVTGYFVPNASGATFEPVSPARLLDTRVGNGLSGPFQALTPRTFQVTGLGNVPLNATAVTGNLTATNQTQAGFVFLGPDEVSNPTSSTLNFPLGDTRANGVTVALSGSGTLSATFGYSGSTHLIFDVTGYFVPDDSGATFVPLSPARLLDTRFGNGLSGPFNALTPRTFQVTGRGGVPYATAVTGNLTATSQTQAGFVFLGPDPVANPTSSTLNFPFGDTRANGVTVDLSVTGTLSGTFGYAGSTHLIFDVTGYFVTDYGLIAWQQNTFPSNSQIWVMNPDGTGGLQLTTIGRNSYPVWSPDGTRIAFSSDRDGNIEIYVMNADGSAQTRLTNTPAGTEIFPTWSPDGLKIAFASYNDTNYDIFVMNANGSGQTNITNHAAEDLHPSWSPDGSKIAFQSNRDGNYEIYTVASDGTGLANVTNSTGSELDPDWSPDGSMLVFAGYLGSGQDIYVMNAAGGGVTQLTATGSNGFPNSMPSWSPDGVTILFMSFRDYNDEVYVMNADGSGETRLTNNAPPGNTLPEDWFPDWQPVVE